MYCTVLTIFCCLCDGLVLENVLLTSLTMTGHCLYFYICYARCLYKIALYKPSFNQCHAESFMFGFIAHVLRVNRQCKVMWQDSYTGTSAVFKVCKFKFKCKQFVFCKTD